MQDTSLRTSIIVGIMILVIVGVFMVRMGLTRKHALQSVKKQADTRIYDYVKTLQAIAGDIEGLQNQFPQLQEFSALSDLHSERLMISYAYHTHTPQRRVGWTGGVPNPDDDGIWFYIDFHEPDSQAQIHTQPVTIPASIGEKRVTFLILEGRKTAPIEGRLWSILEKYGVKRGEIREE